MLVDILWLFYVSPIPHQMALDFVGQVPYGSVVI